MSLQVMNATDGARWAETQIINSLLAAWDEDGANVVVIVDVTLDMPSGLTIKITGLREGKQQAVIYSTAKQYTRDDLVEYGIEAAHALQAQFKSTRALADTVG